MRPATSAGGPARLSSALTSLFALLGLAECAGAEPAPGARTVVFAGTCDASGAVPIDARRFAVAGDEDNVLRIYDAENGGSAIGSIDLSSGLSLQAKKPEADLEAATRLGDRALWISSHARTKKGKVDPDRFRFFATNLPRLDTPVALIAPAYRDLLVDLLADPRLRALGLEAAARKPPDAEGGLNLEGMTATPDGRLLLGFRNPVPEGRALLVALIDPLASLRGERARFDDPIRLDLGGLGVRALSYWRGRYLIAAGPRADEGTSRLFAWNGPGSTPEPQREVAPADFRPEAFFTPEQRDRFMVLSDDGSRGIAGKRCKDLEGADQQFRGIWLELDRAEPAAPRSAYQRATLGG